MIKPVIVVYELIVLTRLVLDCKLKVLKVLAVKIAFRAGQSQIRREAIVCLLDVARFIARTVVGALEWH